MVSWFWLERLLSRSPALELVIALLVRSYQLDSRVLLFKLSNREKTLGSTHLSAQPSFVGPAVITTKGKDSEEFLVIKLFYWAHVQPDGIL